MNRKISISKVPMGFHVEVKFDNGAVETLLIDMDHLPPKGPPRNRTMKSILEGILEDRALQGEHAKLVHRIRELTDAAASFEATTEADTHRSPPFLAEYLISFLAPEKSAQAQLGDLQELFEKNVARIGERQARRKYWVEVARSFGPLLLQWGKRIGFFTVLIDYFRAKFGF